MRLPHTVTVYNFTAAGYQRTVLRGVLWEDTKVRNFSKTGAQDVDSMRLNVPFSVETGGVSYKPPAAFAAAPTGAWTFQTGQKDFIVRGECPFIPASGASISALVTGYDARTITSITTCDYGSPRMQHWEVGAK